MKNKRPFFLTSFKQALLDHAAKVRGSSSHCSKAWIATGMLLLPGLAFGQSVVTSGDVDPSPAVSPVWEVDWGYLSVGLFGTGELTISNGGRVSNTLGFLGVYDTSEGSAVVAGSNSIWENNGALRIGMEGKGILRVEDGGHVTATAIAIADESGSEGNVTVTGTDSTLGTVEGGSRALYVGNKGAGELRIEAGGRVSNVNGFIGTHDGASGIAVVTGEDSLWENSGDLILAGNSTASGTTGTGVLTISDGGTVSVAGTTRVHANGTVNLEAGGTLQTRDLNATDGTFNFEGGALISDGTITGNLSVSELGTLAADTITGDLSVSGLLLSSSLLSETGTGTITVGGDLTLDSTAFTLLKLSGLSEFDQIDVSGELTFGGTLALGFLNDFVLQVNDTFELFTGSYTWVEGTFFESIVFSVPSYEGIFDYDTGTLTFTAIPEPSTYGLLITSAALLAAVRCRCRRYQIARSRG